MPNGGSLWLQKVVFYIIPDGLSDAPANHNEVVKANLLMSGRDGCSERSAAS